MHSGMASHLFVSQIDTVISFNMKNVRIERCIGPSFAAIMVKAAESTFFWAVRARAGLYCIGQNKKT